MTVKANRVLNFLRRNFHDCPSNLKNTLFISNVRPILEYACVLWDPKERYLEQKIEQIQSKAARFVTKNYNFKQSVTALKRQLDWEPLNSRRRRLRLKFLHRIYHDQTGLDKTKFIELPHFVSRRLDHSKKIREFSARTNIFKCSFFPNTVKQWNELPEETISILSSDKFFDKLSRDSWE